MKCVARLDALIGEAQYCLTHEQSFGVYKLQADLATLRARIAELEGAITEALAHVEDEEVKRAGNQCTLCFTYRAMLRTTLAKGGK